MTGVANNVAEAMRLNCKPRPTVVGIGGLSSTSNWWFCTAAAVGKCSLINPNRNVNAYYPISISTQIPEGFVSQQFLAVDKWINHSDAAVILFRAHVFRINRVASGSFGRRQDSAIPV